MEKKELITVHLASGDYQTERMVSKYSDRGGWVAANPKHISSFIPGTIIEIKVKVGDVIKSGEPLMLFGAMKMDNVITSSIDGVISAINVEIGQNVPKGFVMIELK